MSALKPRPRATWEVVLIVTAPVAKSITFRFREEPTSNELDDLLHREGAANCAVYPPTNPND